LAGDRVSIETLMGAAVSIPTYSEVLLDLVYAEFCLREELDENPKSEEYLARYPEHRIDLHRMFEMHVALRSTVNDYLASSNNLENIGDGELGTNRSTLTIISCPTCNAVVDGNLFDRANLSCAVCGWQFAVPERMQFAQLHPGNFLGRFELLQKVGAGQYGEVWKAQDIELLRNVAIKIPHHTDNSRSIRENFLREAQALAILKHPNIVPVFEVSEQADVILIVSDYVDGTSLLERMKREKIAPRQAAVWCAQVARALAYAHRSGIVHRDLKPSNILLDQADAPYVVDFGLAKHESHLASSTKDDRIVGTPAYMSPEQAQGGTELAEPRSDIYSLGVLLYELLCGKRPFEGTVPEVLRSVVRDKPLVPSQRSSGVPTALEAICLKAMSKVCQARYADGDLLADDLERYLNGEPVLATNPSLVRRALWHARRRWVATTAVLALIGTVVFGGFIFKQPPPSRIPPLPGGIRHVAITTEPEGAEVMFIPISDQTGLPMPDKRVAAKGSTPVINTPLMPGNYLVVAWIDGYGFHEVYRHVPRDSTETPSGGAHKRSTQLDDGRVELPNVKLWRDFDVIEGMALVPGKTLAIVDEEAEKQANANLNIYEKGMAFPGFYIDTNEVTIREWKTQTRWLPDPVRLSKWKESDPITHISVDSAIGHLERIGKRLLSDDEYEFAVGTCDPKAGEAKILQKREYISGIAVGGQRSVPQQDSLPLAPNVYNLRGGVAEWTSRIAAIDGTISTETDGLASRYYSLSRIVAGPRPTPKSAFESSVFQLPCVGLWNSRNSIKGESGGIGFRGARSLGPRRFPKEFMHEVWESARPKLAGEEK